MVFDEIFYVTRDTDRRFMVNIDWLKSVAAGNRCKLRTELKMYFKIVGHAAFFSLAVQRPRVRQCIFSSYFDVRLSGPIQGRCVQMIALDDSSGPEMAVIAIASSSPDRGSRFCPLSVIRRLHPVDVILEGMHRRFAHQIANLTVFIHGASEQRQSQ